jgi:hypothetical protein
MKKYFVVIFPVIFPLLLAGCPNNIASDDNPGYSSPTLTIKNESSYDLSQVTWSGLSFSSSGSNDLSKTASVTRNVNGETSGYITFIRKDIGIACRTDELVTIPREGPFIFTDNTVVMETGNIGNKNSLSLISFISKIEIELNGRTVSKNDTVSIGETVLNTGKDTVFTLKNSGVGKLLLNGNAPIKISGEDLENSFTVIQPEGSQIDSGNSLNFTVKFTPKTVKSYTAAITVSSNDPSGDFSFTISAQGVEPKPVVTIWHGTAEILQNDTIDMGEGVVSKTIDAEIAIKNTGTLVLNIDTANITVTGVDAGAFSIVTPPIAAISSGNESKFTIRFTPASTGEKSATVTIPNNDISRNPAVFIIKGTGRQEYPAIELKNGDMVIADNGEKDFGQVETGQTKTESFIIKNTGSVDLILSGTPLVASSNPKFAVTAMPQAAVVPDGTTSFIVTYTPVTEQEDEAEITVISNTQSGLFKFKVKGAGHTKKQQITIRQNTAVIANNGSYNFGSAVTSKQKTATFRIENSGEAVLTLTGNPHVQIIDDAGSCFTVTVQPGNTPIAPGGTAETFIVQFASASAGIKTAKVKITSDSESNGEFIFTVTGTARAASAESRLSSLTFTKGKLDQQFHSDIKNYTLKVDAVETIITATPVCLNADITSLTVNGKTQNSGAASEDVIIASTDTVIVVVLAEDELSSSTYTVTIQQVVNYSSTALSQFWVSNMAGDDVEDVNSIINSSGGVIWGSLPDTTQLKFKPVLVNSNATIKLGTTSIAHNTYTDGYNLSPGSEVTVFNFTVISEDGENERAFEIECYYFGSQWEKVGDFPMNSPGLSYYPQDHTVMIHNNQFILVNVNEVFASASGTSWTKTFAFADTMQHYMHSSVVYNNTIYNIGGVKKNVQDNWESANIVSYSTNGAIFTVASPVSGLAGGVQNHASVVFNGAIYTLGGATQTENQTNAVWRSADGTTWIKQTNPSWGARVGLASVVYNNKLYVIGGGYDVFEYRDVWSSANGTTWTQETASAAWTGRNDHTVNANSKGMWLVGGHDGYFKNDVWFSPDGKTWTQVLQNAPFDTRATHAAVIRDGYLYVFGGVNGSWETPNYLIDIWRTYIGE